MRRLPCQQSPHICAAFPICRRRSTIHFHGFHIQSPGSKNPDIGFDKTSVSGSANQAPIRSPRIPCVDCRLGAACPGGAPILPRPAASPPRSTYPTDPLKFPATTDPLKPAHPTGLTTFPAPAAGLSRSTRPTGLLKYPGGAWARRRLAMRRRRRQGSRHVMVRPVARIPKESGQTRPGKNPQTRRRIAQDG